MFSFQYKKGVEYQAIVHLDKFYCMPINQSTKDIDQWTNAGGFPESRTEGPGQLGVRPPGPAQENSWASYNIS